ncbi:unnamed protein product, partial [Meganyctiphanes norvegica]
MEEEPNIDGAQVRPFSNISRYTVQDDTNGNYIWMKSEDIILCKTNYGLFCQDSPMTVMLYADRQNTTVIGEYEGKAQSQDNNGRSDKVQQGSAKNNGGYGNNNQQNNNNSGSGNDNNNQQNNNNGRRGYGQQGENNGFSTASNGFGNAQQ